MSNSSPLRTKSYKFALHIAVFCKDLMRKEKEYVLSKQLLRAGTSVGANIEEAQQASSPRDFVAKLTISLKEAFESRYWLKLLSDAKYSSKKEISTLLDELNEVINLLLASVKTAKKNLK